MPGAASSTAATTAEEDHVRGVLADLVDRLLGGQPEVDAAPGGHPPGAGAECQQRVHRVRRGEAERGAPRPAERLEQLLLDLVGAVGRPHLLGGEPVAEVARQVGTQRHGVAVRVAVEVPQLRREGLADRLDGRLGHRVGVLVGVQPHGHVELRRPVRRQPAQVVADRQVVEGGHAAPSLRPVTACGPSVPARPLTTRSPGSAR
jgi:hypothetical protein